MRRPRRAAGVHEQKTAGAIGVLRLTRREAGLAEERRLLIAERAGERDARQRRGAGAVELARRANLRQAPARNVEEAKQLLVPIQRLEIHEQRARRIGRVGEMPASRELPDEPGVDRPEQDGAALCARLRLGKVFEEPNEL